MYRERLLSQRLKQLTGAFPAVIVSGARQVGKTTLLRHIFPQHDYVVFDASQDLENARREPDLFLKNHPPPLILDEIQYAPELVPALKRKIDIAPQQMGQYLLTGSQQWQVLHSLAESLAGRCAFLDLHGFSIGELVHETHETHENNDAGWLSAWMRGMADPLTELRQRARFGGSLPEWLWRGSLPRATDIELALIPDFWAGYHRTYVERDARLAGNVDDWQEFGRFVRLMAALTAQEINMSHLGREIGMTPQTARRWLKVMEGTYQWFSLPAYSGNPGKRVVLRPKGYLTDTGLACHHAQISSPQALSSHPLFGPLFETAMAGELLKQAAALATRPSFYHWRAAGGAEVDLVLERDGVLYPIEIKLTAAPGQRATSGIDAFRKAHAHLRVGMGALICAVEQPRWLSDTIVALPWNLT
jgi:predicted AAA+ superfamily ATPase